MQQDNTITNNKFFKYFIIYCLAYSLLGLFFGAFGPLLPYLSEYEGREITDYAILITFRTIFYIVGTFIVKSLNSYLSLHKIFLIGLVSFGISCIMFDIVTHMYLRCIFYVFAAISIAFFQIEANIAASQIYIGNNAESALVILHAFMGIGFLTGPILVAIFQIYAHSSFGFISFCLIIPFCLLKSPDEQFHNQNNEDDLLQNKGQMKIVPKKSLVYCCLNYFIETGIQMAYGAWISSYIILKQLGTKQDGILVSTMFWVSLTAFRLIFSMYPGYPTRKIRYMSLGGLFMPIIGFLIIKTGNFIFGLCFISIMLGLFDSAIFGLLQAQFQEYGFRPTKSQLSTIFLFVGLSDAATIITVGKLCEWIDWNILLIWISISFVIMIIVNQMQKNILQFSQKQCLLQFQMQDIAKEQVD